MCQKYWCFNDGSKVRNISNGEFNQTKISVVSGAEIIAIGNHIQ